MVAAYPLFGTASSACFKSTTSRTRVDLRSSHVLKRQVAICQAKQDGTRGELGRESGCAMKSSVAALMASLVIGVMHRYSILTLTNGYYCFQRHLVSENVFLFLKMYWRAAEEEGLGLLFGGWLIRLYANSASVFLGSRSCQFNLSGVVWGCRLALRRPSLNSQSRISPNRSKWSAPRKLKPLETLALAFLV
jgi:hypothetical protein